MSSFALALESPVKHETIKIEDFAPDDLRELLRSNLPGLETLDTETGFGADKDTMSPAW